MRVRAVTRADALFAALVISGILAAQASESYSSTGKRSEELHRKVRRVVSVPRGTARAAQRPPLPLDRTHLAASPPPHVTSDQLDSLESSRSVRSTAGTAQDRLLRLLLDYLTAGNSSDSSSDWAGSPHTLDLRDDGEIGARGGNIKVAVFVVPLTRPLREDWAVEGGPDRENKRKDKIQYDSYLPPTHQPQRKGYFYPNHIPPSQPSDITNKEKLPPLPTPRRPDDMILPPWEPNNTQRERPLPPKPKTTITRPPQYSEEKLTPSTPRTQDDIFQPPWELGQRPEQLTTKPTHDSKEKLTPSTPRRPDDIFLPSWERGNSPKLKTTTTFTKLPTDSEEKLTPTTPRTQDDIFQPPWELGQRPEQLTTTPPQNSEVKVTPSSPRGPNNKILPPSERGTSQRPKQPTSTLPPGSETTNTWDTSDTLPPPHKQEQLVDLSSEPSQNSSIIQPPYTENVPLLMKLFKEQEPQHPLRPAIVISLVRQSAPPLEPPRNLTRPRRSPSPARPRFLSPLAVRGELTAYHTDYTEPYIAWWDPSTGNSRVDFHDGATNTYRWIRGGLVTRVARKYDRTGDKVIPQCLTMQSYATPHDLQPPFLPMMDLFSFQEYKQIGDDLVEQWTHTQTEDDDATGEQLTYHHEVLLTRCDNLTATPLRYTVSVDSSLLGKQVDWYQHRYLEVQERLPYGNLFHFRVDDQKQCATMTETSSMFEVEPLREFVMESRDPSYKSLFQNFYEKHERRYTDPVERAIRTNILVRSRRFVASGNRVGATFEMELNFLADWLEEELKVLAGSRLEAEERGAGGAGEAAGAGGARQADCTSSRAARRRARRLPDRFDWRLHHIVSRRVYNQRCQSCWAMAVADAVTSAVALHAGARSPLLSVRCIIDCAGPYGGKGCNASSPYAAYKYIEAHGLPAVRDYELHRRKVKKCHDDRTIPVTYIRGYQKVLENSESALKMAIATTPTVVLVDITDNSFRFYKKGTYSDKFGAMCEKGRDKLNHAMLAVGWGKNRNSEYFILKNSWSSQWGRGGYMKLNGPSNSCGVLTAPSYPLVEYSDIDVEHDAFRNLTSRPTPQPRTRARPQRNPAEDDGYL